MIRLLTILILAPLLLSGCSYFQNPEAAEERDSARLLNTGDGRRTWYCYGQDQDKWECRNEQSPALVQKIEAKPARPAPAVVNQPPTREIEPEPEPEFITAESVPDPVNRVLEQPADHYTIQLIALQDRESVLAYARTNGIGDPLTTEIYTEGSRWHVLLLGVYPDQASANAAKEEWIRTRQLKVEPWVRRLGPLQQAVRTALADS